MPRGSWTRLVGCTHSTVHLLLLQGTKPGQDHLSVQRLVSDSTTLLNPELNVSQFTCAKRQRGEQVCVFHQGEHSATGHKKPGTTQMEYNPNDFSQSAINAGQRKINYALTLVDEKLAKAIEALCNAISALPPTHNIDLKNVNDALKEFHYLSKMVAGIKPPGCDPDWPA